MRTAVVLGAAVGAVAIAPGTADAKRRCLPTAPRKPSTVPFKVEAEDGTAEQGRMDLDTAATTTDPGSGAQTLVVTLHFDRYEEGKSVREITDKIEKLALVHQELHRPPTALLTWGTGLAFTGTFTSVAVANTGFLPDGTPVGALAVVRIAILEVCA